MDYFRGTSKEGDLIMKGQEFLFPPNDYAHAANPF
jgi:hypothetical protein